jgi:hypothetical protein
MRAAGTRPAPLTRIRLTRDWIARSGPRRQRRTVLVFYLRKPAVVEFLVLQISPACHRVGRFRVKGRKGRNRVLFRGRIGRTVLSPGTYRLRATVARHRIVERPFVVVRRGRPGEIASARRADACRTERFWSALGAPMGSRPGNDRSAAPPPKARPEKRPVRSHGTLGVKFAQDAVKSIPVWVYMLLGAAIALLGVAALPVRAAPGVYAAELLEKRRGLIAGAGATALVVVTIAYVLG